MAPPSSGTALVERYTSHAKAAININKIAVAPDATATVAMIAKGRWVQRKERDKEYHKLDYFQSLDLRSDVDSMPMHVK